MPANFPVLHRKMGNRCSRGWRRHLSIGHHLLELAACGPRQTASGSRLGVQEVTAENLEVLGREPAVLGDSGQHPRADFLVVVEGKYEIRPALAAEDPMRCSRLPLDGPPDAEQRSQDSIGLGGRPITHAGTANTS